MYLVLLDLKGKEFCRISVENIQSTFLNIGSSARCLGGLIFCWSRGNWLFFFQFFFLDTFWNSIYLSIYHSLDQRIWFMVMFFLSTRAAFCSKYEFSLLNCPIFCPIMKIYSNHFNGEWESGHPWWNLGWE